MVDVVTIFISFTKFIISVIAVLLIVASILQVYDWFDDPTCGYDKYSIIITVNEMASKVVWILVLILTIILIWVE